MHMQHRHAQSQSVPVVLVYLHNQRPTDDTLGRFLQNLFRSISCPTEGRGEGAEMNGEGCVISAKLQCLL